MLKICDSKGNCYTEEQIAGLLNGGLIDLEKKARAFDWLMMGSRRDYIWYQVLSDEDRELDDFLEKVIYKASERDK